MFGTTNRFLAISRGSNVVLDTVTAASSHNPDRQAAGTCCFKVVIAGGNPGSGTVMLVGLVVPSTSDNESVLFTANATKSGNKRFTRLDSIVTSGFTDESPRPTITIYAITPDGHPVWTHTNYVTGYPATFSNSGSKWPNPPPGTIQVESGRFVLAFSEAFTPQTGDIITDDLSQRWEIQRCTPIVRRHFTEGWDIKANLLP